MHSRLDELVGFIDGERAKLCVTVSGASPAAMTARPAGGGWSVVQVLDHLRRVESGVARLVGRRTAGARENGVGAEMSAESVLGALDWAGLDRRDNPVEAPPQVQPAAAPDPDTTLAELAESRTALLQALAQATGLALDQLRQAHPLLGELDLYQWVLFVGKHEARHRGQIASILQEGELP